MSSPYVCMTCRQAISHLRRNKAFQWHSKATFNSLISTPQSSTSEQHKEDYAESTRGFQGGETRNRPKLPRRPPATRHATREPADALESMFEDTLKQQSIRQPTRTSELSQRTSSTVKAYQDGEKLKELLRDERPLNDCWSFFVEHFGPTAWKNGTISRNSWPVYLKSTVPRMLRLIRDQRKQQPLRNDVPTFSEMILVTLELGLLRGTQWVQMITTLIDSILEAGLTTTEGQTLLSELLKSWNIVCRRRPRRLQSQEFINKSDPEVIPSCSDWSNLPSHSLHSIFLEKRQNGTQYAFSLLTPQFSPGEMYQLPTIALGTLKLLLELDKTGIGAATMVEDAKPLMLKFSNIVNACSMSLIDAAEFFRDVPESVVSLVKDDWSTIKEFTGKQNVRSDFRVTENMRTQVLHKKVIDAHARRDVASLDRLWSQAQQLPIYIPNAKDGFESGYRTGYLTPAFYNLFILLFMNLRQQTRAIEVWNHMIKNNLTPNLGAWDAMLNGCKNSRDAKGLEQVWAMMISSGEKPDVTCWTTRISGLIHCYQPEAGIRALDEMGRLWLAAARKKYPNLKISNSKNVKDIPGAVRPTIATINAAVSGLIKRQEIKAADRILAWADQWGIIPDIQTYNTLLSSIVRAGHPDKTPEILTSMEGHGVQADAATFVTILDQTFADIETLSPAEQIEAINNTFLAMEQMKVTPNQFLYGKMIYLLLRGVPTDITPVSEVMNRMAAQGLTPSTYIYTILLEYYFAQSPPNFQAATTLIERAQLTAGTVDHIFWDRLIEGYASVGDTDTAISYLRNVQKSKQFTSWNTMRTLLMALVEKDEWDVATELVNNAVKDTGGPIGADVKGVEGQHKFWELVRELRILD